MTENKISAFSHEVNVFFEELKDYLINTKDMYILPNASLWQDSDFSIDKLQENISKIWLYLSKKTRRVTDYEADKLITTLLPVNIPFMLDYLKVWNIGKDLYDFIYTDSQYKSTNIVILSNTVKKLDRIIIGYKYDNNEIIQVVTEESGYYFQNTCIDKTDPRFKKLKPMSVIKVNLKKIYHEYKPNLYCCGNNDIVELGQTKLNELILKINRIADDDDINYPKIEKTPLVSHINNVIHNGDICRETFRPYFMVRFSGSLINRDKNGFFQLVFKLTYKKTIYFKINTDLQPDKANMYFRGLSLVYCYKTPKCMGLRILELFGDYLTFEQLQCKKQKSKKQDRKKTSEYDRTYDYYDSEDDNYDLGNYCEYDNDIDAYEKDIFDKEYMYEEDYLNDDSGYKDELDSDYYDNDYSNIYEKLLHEEMIEEMQKAAEEDIQRYTLTEEIINNSIEDEKYKEYINYPVYLFPDFKTDEFAIDFRHMTRLQQISKEMEAYVDERQNINENELTILAEDDTSLMNVF